MLTKILLNSYEFKPKVFHRNKWKKFIKFTLEFYNSDADVCDENNKYIVGVIVTISIMKDYTLSGKLVMIFTKSTIYQEANYTEILRKVRKKWGNETADILNEVLQFANYKAALYLDKP